MDKKVLVVDLDGTLYKVNTFHAFLKYLLKHFFKEFNIFKCQRLIVLLKLRFFRLISHARLKYQVLKLIQDETIDLKTFVTKLSIYKNEIPELSHSEFDIKVLATAAPKCYADVIAKENGFDHCLATKFPMKDFYSTFENLGVEKKTNLQNYLKSQNLKAVNLFITDHKDDIPTIKIAKKSIIINPNNQFSIWLKENLINFEIRQIN